MMNQRKESIRYSALQGCYMMMMCAGFNFVNYYLLEFGVADSTVGILVALSSATAIVLQQLLGRLVDSGRLEGKTTILGLAVLQFTVSLLMAFLHNRSLNVILFGVLLFSTLAMQPLLNAFVFYYHRAGVGVNFGVARGVGSLCYSGCSMLLGLLTVSLGSFVVPLSFAFLGAAVFAIVLFMPSLQGVRPAEQAGGKARPLRLSKYPAFTVMLVGLSLVMFFHNMVMTYFLHVVERAGGDSSHMGIAIGIAGFVEIPILFLYTRIKGNRSSRIFLAISGAAFFAKAVLFLFAHNIGMIYAIQCLQCLAFGLMAASRVYYTDEVIGKEHETTGQACMSATESIGIILGSMVGGFLMQASGVDTLLWIGAVICGIGMILIFVSASLSRRR